MCIIYPTGATFPQFLFVPEAEANWDTFPYVWHHADPAKWFPNGMRIKKIKRMPRVAFRLEYSYQIYFDRDETSSIQNMSIAHQFDQFWMGNIIVVKRGRADPFMVAQMEWGDIGLTNLILGNWLEEVAKRRIHG